MVILRSVKSQQPQKEKKTRRTAMLTILVQITVNTTNSTTQRLIPITDHNDEDHFTFDHYLAEKKTISTVPLKTNRMNHLIPVKARECDGITARERKMYWLYPNSKIPSRIRMVCMLCTLLIAGVTIGIPIFILPIVQYIRHEECLTVTSLQGFIPISWTVRSMLQLLYVSSSLSLSTMHQTHTTKRFPISLHWLSQSRTKPPILPFRNKIQSNRRHSSFHS